MFRHVPLFHFSLQHEFGDRRWTGHEGAQYAKSRGFGENPEKTSDLVDMRIRERGTCFCRHRVLLYTYIAM